MTTTATSHAVLRAIDLAVGYQSRKSSCRVLEGLDFTVKRGELVCLLGPNGVGKSTLLRTISKIQPALEGSIELDGVNLRDLTSMELARKLGVVLTERVEVGSLPAYRVVELGRYPHLNWSGKLTDQDHEVVCWAIDAVGAQHLATRDSSKLSDGERQRLMIARALAQEPVLLLLDEPTAFLDVPSRVELMGLLRHLARNEGLGIVLSTHDLELALRTADTIWLVAPGGRFYSGAPEDIVLAGHLATAFESDRITFQPEERTFRLLGGSYGRVLVRGQGLPAILGAAVLEREGYEVTRDGSADFLVTIDRDAMWQAASGSRRSTGQSFAELAEFARSIIEPSTVDLA